MTDTRLVAELRQLQELGDEDPRTIEQMQAEDRYEDIVVEKARRSDDGYTTVSWNDGITTSLKGPEVKVGDTVRMFGGASLGDQRHGWALNGDVIEWQTPWERFADRIAWLAKYDREQRERFVAEQAELDSKYDELPPPLKARIDRFRAKDPTFRIKSESYEMAAVHDAPKIAVALAGQQGWSLDENLFADQDEETVVEVVKAFYDLRYDQQKALVPTLNEGHSGNTFGAAVNLARALLAGLEC